MLAAPAVTTDVEAPPLRLRVHARKGKTIDDLRKALKRGRDQGLDFPIGVGEIYTTRYASGLIFVEVRAVKRHCNGRQIFTTMIDAKTCERVEGTDRIHFGAGDFLNSYRPARPEDFR